MGKYKNNFIDYEYDDEEVTFEKFRNRNGKKKKGSGHGHVSRSNRQQNWDLLEESLEDDSISKVPQILETLSPTICNPITNTKSNQIIQKNSVEKTQKPQLIFGPNTHEIKNIKIDYDRLANMEKTDGEYDGHQTFGIKFLFQGTKGSFRIIWFGRNIYERDRVYTAEFNFWNSLKNRG